MEKRIGESITKKSKRKQFIFDRLPTAFLRRIFYVYLEIYTSLQSKNKLKKQLNAFEI